MNVMALLLVVTMFLENLQGTVGGSGNYCKHRLQELKSVAHKLILLITTKLDTPHTF